MFTTYLNLLSFLWNTNLWENGFSLLDLGFIQGFKLD